VIMFHWTWGNWRGFNVGGGFGFFPRYIFIWADLIIGGFTYTKIRRHHEIHN